MIEKIAFQGTRHIDGPDNLVFTTFINESILSGMKYFHAISYDCKELDTTGAEVVGFDADENKTKALFSHGKWGDGTVQAIAYMCITRSNNKIGIHVAADSETLGKTYLAELMKRAPKFESVDPDTVNVSFWSQSATGPNSRSRELVVPSWKDIRPNYAAKTATRLDELMDSEFRIDQGGQLILWSGEPGTGKTTALRALGKSWKDWCQLNYITDPDRFFGSDADYMLSVLLDNSNDYEWNAPGDFKQTDKWRLLILEDTGELLKKDAKASMGQGLSRFLNVVDGLIGQGLKIMILVTTNEELHSLNDAVARPGRCYSNIMFNKLSEDEVKVWVKMHKVDKTLKGEQILADLYAYTYKKEEDVTENKTFGFS